MHYKRNNNNSKKFQQWGLQQSINNWTTMPKRPLSSLLPTHIDHQILTPSEYFLFSAVSAHPGGDKSRSKSYFTPYSQDSWKMVFAMLRDDCYLLFGVFGAFYFFNSMWRHSSRIFKLMYFLAKIPFIILWKDTFSHFYTVLFYWRRDCSFLRFSKFSRRDWRMALV